MTTFAKKKYKEFGNKFGLSVFIFYFYFFLAVSHLNCMQHSMAKLSMEYCIVHEE